MNLLAIDTSGPVCGVCVLADGRVAYEGAAVNKLTHSVNLLPMINEGLTRAGLTIGQIDLYAAVVGPGSFTGVRIGVSTLKGLAHAAHKPCVGVDALEALAAGLSDTDALLCPIQDARAGQVYCAASRSWLPPERALPDEAAKLDEYLAHALEAAGEKPLCFTGDGVATYRAAIEDKLGARAAFAPAHLCYLRPASAAALALCYADKAVDYLALTPKYLRAPQAERARAARLGARA